ncbi:MFS transporter [Oceanobacillus timonensis]|nr:MFS transporter [Oceanobacillus timonensis]
MTFTIYGVLSVVAVFFIWKFVPETKGKTLEELENIWVEKKSDKKSEL